MGQPLDDVMLRAFVAEVAFLEKHAGLKDLAVGAGGWLKKTLGGQVKGWQEAGEAALHPIRSIRQGWHASAPMNEVRKAGQTIHGGEHMMNRGERLRDIVKGDIWKGNMPSNQGRGRVRALAEELSRRGWTGRGNMTKYMPVGMKSWAVIPAAMSAPDIAEAYKKPATPTGEGGGTEALGGLLGGTGAFIAGTRLGVLPGIGLYFAGEHAGKRLGRIADRMRGGAGLKDAITAPTPEEAANQLETIQRYYG